VRAAQNQISLILPQHDFFARGGDEKFQTKHKKRTIFCHFSPIFSFLHASQLSTLQIFTILPFPHIQHNTNIRHKRHNMSFSELFGFFLKKGRLEIESDSTECTDIPDFHCQEDSFVRFSSNFPSEEKVCDGLQPEIPN